MFKDYKDAIFYQWQIILNHKDRDRFAPATNL